MLLPQLRKFLQLHAPKPLDLFPKAGQKECPKICPPLQFHREAVDDIEPGGPELYAADLVTQSAKIIRNAPAPKGPTSS